MAVLQRYIALCAICTPSANNMLGFKKIKRGRRREFYFCGVRLYGYQKKPTPREAADLKLQAAMERAFWASHSASFSEGGSLVSLTTFGKRADTVHITLQTLLEQTLPPARILLWLDEAEFQPDNLPANLCHALARGVDIRFCKNLLSYKKIIPALEAFPGNAVITVDDDVMYPPDFIAGLARSHAKYPEHVLCYRAHEMMFDEQGALLPYQQWRKCVRYPAAGTLLFPTGSGGVLYPAGSLHPEVLNVPAFMQLAPRGDDIWLKAMTMIQGRAAMVVPGENSWVDVPPSIADTQVDCLAIENLREGNDRQIAQVFDAYDIWRLLTVTPGAK